MFDLPELAVGYEPHEAAIRRPEGIGRALGAGQSSGFGGIERAEKEKLRPAGVRGREHQVSAVRREGKPLF